MQVYMNDGTTLEDYLDERIKTLIKANLKLSSGTTWSDDGLEIKLYWGDEVDCFDETYMSVPSIWLNKDQWDSSYC